MAAVETPQPSSVAVDESGLPLHCDLVSICVTVYALCPREERRKQDCVVQPHPGARLTEISIGPLFVVATEVLG